MRKTRFYPTVWQAMVFPSSIDGQRDNSGRRVRELILHSELATELGVSEMELNLNTISVIDIQCAEHPISNFPGQHCLPIKSLASGHFLKSKRMTDLPKGTYVKLRFYLGSNDNQFIYSDGTSEIPKNYEYLDFDIKNPLTIDGQDADEVKLWFDFPPLKFSRHFKKMLDLFKNSRMPRPNFAGTYGH